MVREEASDRKEQPREGGTGFYFGQGREGVDCKVEDGEVVVENKSCHTG